MRVAHATWCATALAVASVAGAQPVLGPGDDATLPAPGQLRVRAQLTFGAAGERAGGRTGGGSGRVAIGSEFGADSLTPRLIPGLTAARDSLRLATGVPTLALSVGTLGVRARVNTSSAPVLAEYGVTRRLAVSVLVPFLQTRTLVDVRPNADGGAGNFGLNPARGSDAAATAAQAQTRDALSNLTSAVSAVRARCPSAAAADGCLAATAVADAAARVAAQLQSVYGTGAAGSGQLVIPLVASDAQAAVAARIAQLGAQFTQFGVAFDPSKVPAPSRARIGLPGLRALVNDPAFGVAVIPINSPFGSETRGSFGDLELAASLNVLDTFGRAGAGRDAAVRARVAPAAGVRVRATVTGGFRFATGTATRTPVLLFDVPPAERSAAVVGRAAADVAVGRRVSASAVARVAVPVADRQTLRIPLGDDTFFAPRFAVQDVGRRLGRELELAVTPRYATGESFAVAAQGVLRTRGEARYTGTFALTPAQTGGDAATLDAAALGVGTGGREARLGIGASYSTVAAAARRGRGLPLEVSFLHSTTVAASGGAIPYVTSDQIAVRVYASLFGR